MKKTLLLLLILGTVNVFGVEVTWVKLNPLFSYRDLFNFCNTKSDITGGRDFYLGLESEQGTVERAILKDGNFSFSNVITFSSAEAQQIQLTEDSNKQYWVKSMFLSSKIVNWIFYHMGDSMFGCVPGGEIATMTPSTKSFEFDLSTINSFPAQGSSDAGKFSGRLKDGTGYQAELQFIQKQVNN